MGSLALIVLFIPVTAGVADQLDVSSGRPLADAMREFQRRHSWPIYYEDPPFRYPADLVDEALPEYRRQHPQDPAGWSPRGGKLSSTYSAPSNVETAENAIRQIVSAYNASDFPADYELLRINDAFHVRPVKIHDARGAIV